MELFYSSMSERVEFNVPQYTVYIILQAVLTADCLTDTNKKRVQEILSTTY